MDDTCIHCNDDIVLNDDRGVWVDVNGLSSCAPVAPHHEPDKHVHITVWLPDGTIGHYAVHQEFWEKDLERLLGSPSTTRC